MASGALILMLWVTHLCDRHLVEVTISAVQSLVLTHSSGATARLTLNLHGDGHLEASFQMTIGEAHRWCF